MNDEPELIVTDYCPSDFLTKKQIMTIQREAVHIREIEEEVLEEEEDDDWSSCVREYRLMQSTLKPGQDLQEDNTILPGTFSPSPTYQTA